MRVIFAGTPEFARVALERLHKAGHDIVLVLTQPDRPAGRGMKLQPSAVKTYALAHNMPVCQPHSLRLDGKYADDALVAQAAIYAAQADAMVVAAYGLILPQWVLDSVGAQNKGQYGCLNIHPSLLPRWRGAAPVHRAVEAGDAITGVTVIQMDMGLDTGDILLAQSVPIACNDTTGTLNDKLAIVGGDLIVQALELAHQGRLQPQPQTEIGMTYASKIDKSKSVVDWAQPVEVIERQIRTLNPMPGAATEIEGSVIKIWRSEVDSMNINTSNDCGTILSINSDGIKVKCGSGVLRLTELQRAGSKRLPVADFVHGPGNVRPGARFGKQEG